MPFVGSAPQNYSHDFLVLPNGDGGQATVIAAGANGSPGAWRRDSKAEGHILRSNDGARSWQRLAGGLPTMTPRMPWALTPDPRDADSALAAFGDYPTGGGELYLTHDRGDSWERVEGTFPAVRAVVLEVA
jgi:photosystem II stability/assembly factor-like uncharacterized protein